MFLRYMASLLLLGSLSSYAMNPTPTEGYMVLEGYEKNGETKKLYILQQALYRPLNDFWLDEEPVNFSERGKLLSEVVSRIGTKKDPQNKLWRLPAQTFRHHSSLLDDCYEEECSPFNNPTEVADSIKKAFPGIEAHREIVKRRRQFESK